MKFLLTLFILTLSIGTVSAADVCTLVKAEHAAEGSTLSVGDELPAAACPSYKSGDFKADYAACECAKAEETTPVIAGESQCGDDKVEGKSTGTEGDGDGDGGNAGGVEN